MPVTKVSVKAARASRGITGETQTRKAARPARRVPAPPRTGASRRNERVGTVPAAAPPASPQTEDEGEETPLVDTPTSFNLDLRRARNLRGTVDDANSTDPNSPETLAAGDRDVSPESAGTVGDETPGGDNPTPDMDVVDLIGRSLGVEYEDTEELKGADKIAERDRRRWELDPASSEDCKDRKRS